MSDLEMGYGHTDHRREALYRYKNCAVCGCPGKHSVTQDAAFKACFPNLGTIRQTAIVICSDCNLLAERKRKRMETETEKPPA